MGVLAREVQRDPSRAAQISGFATEVQDRTTDTIIGLYEGRNDKVTFRVIVSPMVSWIWAGAILGIIGALFALWPAGVLGRARGRVGARIRGRRPESDGRPGQDPEPGPEPGPESDSRPGQEPLPGGPSVSAAAGEDG